MSTPAPRRRHRRRKPRSTEEGEISPRRRKKPTDSRGSRKKNVNNIFIVKSIVAVIAVFAVIVGIFFFDWRDIGVSIGMERSPEKLLSDLKYYQKKQLNLIASFQDKEHAKAAIPQLNKVAKELAKISAEYDDWHTIEEDDEIQEHLKLAPEIRESMSKIAREISRLRSKHQFLLREEINRLQGNTAFKSYVTQLVGNARSAGGKYAQKLRLEKAKEGAYKHGYSSVTENTKLTQGMHLQGISDQYDWEDCVVRAVNQDGTVRVSFHDQTTQEIFGEGSAYFDKKLERDQLRIPDGVGAIQVQQNPAPSRTGRRIEGTAKRPDVTGKRILSHPPAKPRSDRSF
ncbi:hypothetical protein [Gimesia fumaroli]|uniref:Uncharacterized protein n=1 Tax=Gimesia fumaroli TaxID=2527976 RepID=A0A518IFX1_9PLAN|nr:hypothetical protein [Gimesia fumaroli]QDV51974.1 hypothetical protein Enr17x_40330 [Gimesia fumaroli]